MVFGPREVPAEHRKTQGPHDPEDKGDDEVRLRAHFPEKRPTQGGHGHEQVTHQVIQTEHAGLAVVRSQVHNQGLTGRLAELLESSDDEGQHQPFKRAAEHEDDGKKRKKNEGDDHKGFLGAAIRQVGHRNVDQHRRGHFDAGEQTELDGRHRVWQ